MWRETDMETFEANSIFALKQTSQSELGFASSDSVTHFTTTQSQSTLDSDCFTDESLSQKFENIGLRSNEDESSNESHPLRPYAEDCPFFLRTRTCKFGLNCKFNHPVRRTNQKAGKEKEKDTGKAKEGFSEKPEQTECKNYLTPGGCKYGKSCRYNHSKDESEIAPPELNFLGLPIRLGEKEWVARHAGPHAKWFLWIWSSLQVSPS
ncbi:zinc finger CCCH domain-containing protein 67-like [Camellia sinensis]|uniref:zinc finger CCCH domain-containing protein 67-like n=1 Tax=Camellia sinensis TaxID=4442 RepID=UPI001036B287|nr:zinc finger CCCH domain-containing protein 67-like [Camellia sinensis]